MRQNVLDTTKHTSRSGVCNHAYGDAQIAPIKLSQTDQMETDAYVFQA